LGIFDYPRKKVKQGRLLLKSTTISVFSLLTAVEKAEKNKEAEVIKCISPIAWRHVNFLGRFELQKQQNQFNIDEIIKSLQNEPAWQKPEVIEESLQQKSYFTFSGR
jgi:hypothetical protein